MSQFDFTVCHPTARIDPAKPLWWFYSMLEFYKRADNPQRIQYVLSVHHSRWEQFQQVHRDTIALGHRWGQFKLLCNPWIDSAYSQGHYCADNSEGILLIGGMDDLFPPDHWDTLLWEAYATRGGSEWSEPSEPSAVIHVSSGSPNDANLFIPQILSRARYDEYGYAAHPSYAECTMYCDNEFTDLARRDGVVIEAPHIRFEHRHPAFGTAEMDEVYALENRRESYEKGRALYELRKSLNFPKDPAWRPAADLPLSNGHKIICLCFPGESFPSAVMHSALELATHCARTMNLQICMGHTSNVYVTRGQITELALSHPTGLADYVYWQDDDNAAMAAQMDMLIGDLESHPELDGVVGWCWCDRNDETQRGQPFMMSCGRQGEHLEMLPLEIADVQRAAESPDYLVPIDWSGFPCVLLRGAALKAMGPESFAPIVRPDVKFGFLSEDAAFFLRAKEKGLKFAVDLRVKVPHVKLRAIEPQVIVRSPEALEIASNWVTPDRQNELEQRRRLVEQATLTEV